MYRNTAYDGRRKMTQLKSSTQVISSEQTFRCTTHSCLICYSDITRQHSHMRLRHWCSMAALCPVQRFKCTAFCCMEITHRIGLKKLGTIKKHTNFMLSNANRACCCGSSLDDGCAGGGNKYWLTSWLCAWKRCMASCRIAMSWAAAAAAGDMPSFMRCKSANCSGVRPAAEAA